MVAVHDKDLGIHLAKDLGISVPKELAKDLGIRLAKGADTMATTASCCTSVHVVASVGISVPRMHSKEDSKGYTTLHKAAQKDQTDILEWLVSSGASVHAAAVNGRTPLHVAAVYGQVGYLTHYSLTNYSPLTH